MWRAGTSASPRPCRHCSGWATRCGRCRPSCSPAGRASAVREARLPPADLAACWPRWRPTAAGRSLDAVFTGYFPSPQSVAAAAQAIARIKAANPQPPRAVDPVLGDAGGSTSRRRRQRPSATLLPLADPSPRPTCSSCSWLTGARAASAIEIARAARAPRPADRRRRPRRCRPPTSVSDPAGDAPSAASSDVPARARHSQRRRRPVRRAVPRALAQRAEPPRLRSTPACRPRSRAGRQRVAAASCSSPRS